MLHAQHKAVTLCRNNNYATHIFDDIGIITIQLKLPLKYVHKSVLFLFLFSPI